MQKLLRWLAVLIVLIAGWAAPPPHVGADSLGPAANRVVGQPAFTHNTANNGGLGTKSLDVPGGVAVDAHGNLYVADTLNNRALEYDAPLTTTQAAATRVIGQPDFTHNTFNNGGPSANSLNVPGGVAVDAHGNLYVADYANNRVLAYDAPLATTYATATRVIGQPDFATNGINTGGLSANSLSFPRGGMAVDAHGNLYVADSDNNRVLEYDAPLTTTHAAATRVIGQPDFTHNTVNNGGVSATSLANPTGVALDAHGNLFVADTANNRVLEYDAPLAITDMAATRVIGQPDYTQNLANNGGLSASSLFEPFAVALDAHGNLYVADSDNNRVLEYDRLSLPLALFLPLVLR